jgi:hypothetical protein
LETIRRKPMKKTLWRGLGLAVLGALMAITTVPASTATAAEPLSVEIVIVTQWSVSGDLWPGTWTFHRGRFVLTGDVEDRGKVVCFSEGPCLHLQGKKGSLVLEFNAATAEWSVVAGTGAYAGMTGGGSWTGAWGGQLGRWWTCNYWFVGYLQP